MLLTLTQTSHNISSNYGRKTVLVLQCLGKQAELKSFQEFSQRSIHLFAIFTGHEQHHCLVE